MRKSFDEQLKELGAELTQMGALCETAIANAAQALFEGDGRFAQEAVRADEEIDNRERKIEALCLKLLLRQQPVARDLRQISSALKMITDMERIGDQARDIAEITKYVNLQHVEPALSIKEMAQHTIKMVMESISAYVNRDLEQASAAIDHDDVVDALFDKVKGELIAMIAKNPAYGEQALDLLMIAKYFERIGDHATNIAEWVEFSLTGKHRADLQPEEK
ncbi:MAG: phosphate signaling complex protein PhoU [Oscillospiraceae bacterium]